MSKIEPAHFDPNNDSQIKSIKDTFEARYQELLTAASNTTNVWDRYNTQIRIEELKEMYNKLFK